MGHFLPEALNPQQEFQWFIAPEDECIPLALSTLSSFTVFLFSLCL